MSSSSYKPHHIRRVQDYIFSFIKKFRASPRFVFPDRDSVGMDRPFMSAYVRLLIQTCHKRGVHAMGGMAAQIPIKNDEAKNKAAMENVYADKVREVKAGHDGTWVAHPGLISIARRAFEQHIRSSTGVSVISNQIWFKPQYERPITAADLVNIGREGQITRSGLRVNIDVGLRYLEAWLRGVGCVPIYNKMEDAATAEISRSQVWQWLRHHAQLASGETVTSELVNIEFNSVLNDIRAQLGPSSFSKTRFDIAAKLYRNLMLDDVLHEFLTIDAYPYIVRISQPRL
jgi:malate synthase